MILVACANPSGRWLQKKCKDNGIATIGPTIGEWSRLCLTIKSDADRADAELLGHGPDINPNISEAFYSAYNFIAHNNPEAVIICGSTSVGLDQNIYNQLVSYAKQFDTSTFIDASGSLLPHTPEAYAYSVHINLQEGRELFDLSNPVDITKQIGRLLFGGCCNGRQERPLFTL